MTKKNDKNPEILQELNKFSKNVKWDLRVLNEKCNVKNVNKMK